MTIDLNVAWTQQDLADLVGISQPTVSNLIADGKIPTGLPLGETLLAYCQRLREQASGRLGSEVGGLDLVQERAALAREQRVAQAMKNDIARGEYAPIGLLTDVLAAASSAVVDGFDHLEGALAKACPDLPDDAKTTVMKVIASARNQWIRSTMKLVCDDLDSMALEDDAEPDLDEFEVDE